MLIILILITEKFLLISICYSDMDFINNFIISMNLCVSAINHMHRYKNFNELNLSGGINKQITSAINFLFDLTSIAPL